MGAEDEARLRQVKRGERRVAELDCHVRCLREKLARLERMLPAEATIDTGRAQAEKEFRNSSSSSGGGGSGSEARCPLDRLANKEKSLRKRIYDMQLTEAEYVRKIAAMDGPQAERTRKRLELLEGYSRKISCNLESLEKNHAGLALEARNLSDVLDETRKARGDGEKACSCNLLAKCDSCIVCSCDEWERDQLDNAEAETAKRADERRSPRQKRSCTCYETSSSSSDSEGSCDCKYAQDKQMSTGNDCGCKVTELPESESSICSEDDKTLHSEPSQYTCYCSKDHSHEDLQLDPKKAQKSPRVERFRGGLEVTSPLPSLQGAVVEQLKVLDLREGLERLKLRNRDLKDFLGNLDQPLGGTRKQSRQSLEERAKRLMEPEPRRRHDARIILIPLLLIVGWHKSTELAGYLAAARKSLSESNGLWKRIPAMLYAARESIDSLWKLSKERADIASSLLDGNLLCAACLATGILGVLVKFRRELGRLSSAVLGSRLFWLLLGVAGHKLWTALLPDVRELYQEYQVGREERSPGLVGLGADDVCELFAELDVYSWIVAVLDSKLQWLAELLGYALASVA